MSLDPKNFEQIRLIGGTSHPKFTEAIARELGVTPVSLEVSKFQNDNLFIKIKENVREADVFVIQTSVPPVNDGCMELFMTLDALRGSSARRITAVIPYFPYVRSDKKDQPRISIAAKLLADLLQQSGADRVLTLELHASQIQGFFSIPCDQLFATNIMCDYLKTLPDIKDYVIVAADVGESKHLGRYANKLNLPLAIIDKRRIGNNDKTEPVYLIGNVEGKRALIIDDEISTASTLCSAANFLKQHGALSVSACVVHPVLVGKSIDYINNSELDEVIITDSIPLGPKKQLIKKKITTLSVSSLFAQAITRIHDGRSISDLF